MQITAKRVNNSQIGIHITNEKGEVVFHEITHEFAWDSFVDIARQVLWNHEQIKIKDEIELGINKH